jgi:hypothetical protein
LVPESYDVKLVEVDDLPKFPENPGGKSATAVRSGEKLAW